ncbi:MAG: phosphatidylserine/phosphatidylglycerophosphate/cardiolipin synthase family protein [Bacteroidota bacterium]
MAGAWPPLIVLSLLLCSCVSGDPGGLFPGTEDAPAEVSLHTLADYYASKTGGLIRLTPAGTAPWTGSVRFTWDPYDKLRILAPVHVPPAEVQDLFALDADRFVERSGKRDFLSAAHALYVDSPFDETRQNHLRPYRCLKAWGSLMYPPLKQLDRSLSFYHEEFGERFDPDTLGTPLFDAEFQRRLDDETQSELTYGNSLRALFNGVESYPQKLRLAGEARRLLYVAVMTIIADATGRELIRVMVERKRRGVDVRLITEDFYTFSVSNYAVGVLEREGIPVVRVADKRLNQIDRMFHNKIWIRDGEEAILGGMNILDYENESDGFNFLNRDTDLLIQGPAVTSLLESFIRLWKRYDRDNRPIAAAESLLADNLASERAAGVRGREHYDRWLGNPSTRMNGICRTAVQGDNAEPQRIVTMLARYLGAARHSMYMTSPEIEFDLETRQPGEIDRLARVMHERARDSSFRIVYITNGKDGGLGESTSFLRSRVKDAQLVGEPLWEDMLTPMIDKEGREVAARVRTMIAPLVRAGVRGYQYFNYMHAKEFYFDRVLVGIGSWNFDLYSAENNHESAVFCLDRSLRLQLERQLVLDMVNSVPVVFPQEVR